MYIAIDSSNDDLVGAITYWRLTGDVNGDDLNNALRGTGLSDESLLKLTTPRRALRRTLQEHARGNVFMRAGKSGGGLYLVQQSQGDDGPVFDAMVEARLNLAGIPAFTISPDYAPGHTDQEDEDIEAKLRERFWHHIWHVAAADISSWLIDQARQCDGVTLRESGGVYFVPRDRLDEWQQRVEALHAETACHVYMVPAMDSQQALDAVVAALIAEATAFSGSLQTDLDSGDLGERALKSRADQAKAHLEKLARYEQLLGAVAAQRLTALRDGIMEQQTNAIAAALSVEVAS
jgi:hypothetical protein